MRHTAGNRYERISHRTSGARRLGIQDPRSPVYAPASRWRGPNVHLVESEDACRRMATALRSMGLAEGDKVAILAKNSAEWILADIAIAAADSHRALTGEEPKVALLSFSTKESADHPRVDKVLEALSIVRANRPDLCVDGELQFDAAYNKKVAAMKAPDSEVAGKANVYIFPDLDSGNIGYKIAQRLGNTEAIGPVIQGLAKPFNDLSRGCSIEDVINTACICSLMA